MMTFWICYLSMLALVVTYAPQGGLQLAGLVLFADHRPDRSASDGDARHRAFGNGAKRGASAFLAVSILVRPACMLFAMLFYVFGEEAEQREARPLAKAPRLHVALAAVRLSVMIAFAGGEAGAMLGLAVGALGGLALMVMALGQPDAFDARRRKGSDSIELDVIADHAATHAAFSAQIASIVASGAPVMKDIPDPLGNADRTLLGGWYGLSYYDMNFGFRILSRDLHDLVFTIYGDLLGIPPESIPPLVLKAIILDTFLVLGFIVIKRRRKQIWSALTGWLGWTERGRCRNDTAALPKSSFHDLS
jgi:hypothetical protein